MSGLKRFLSFACGPALSALLLTCQMPLFNNPVDPGAEDYIGTDSADLDGDGIGQWEDVDDITLVSPADAETITTLPLILTAYKHDPVKVGQYRIQISTSDAFETEAIVFDHDGFTTNACEIPLGVFAENIPYFWRAKAFDGSRWSDKWSAVCSVRIALAGGVPLVPMPASGHATIDTKPLLDWEDVAGATGYRVQVNTVSDFSGSDVAVSGELEASQYRLPDSLSRNATYYWRARAKNAEGVWGAWSRTWNIHIDSVRAISSSGDHTVAVLSEGTVWAWGQNFFRQLGDRTNVDRRSPVQASGLNGVKAVAAGGGYTVILKEDATVWAWGYNANGQLGDGTTYNRPSAVSVGGLNGVTAIAAADSYAAVLKNDGTVWTWGKNSASQLGDGTTTDRTSPVQVSGLSDVTAIALGTWTMAALRSDGTVMAWGGNSGGQLCDGTTDVRRTPVQVSGLVQVKAIAVGGRHILALKDDGTVWACGGNENGQLGDGTTTGRTSPVQVSGLSDVTAIAAGRTSSMVLKEDGTVWTWGANDQGELGDGTFDSRSAPVRVLGLDGVVAIGMNSSGLALKDDGTLWAWGRNIDGWLGIGTSSSYCHIPLQVAW